MTDSYDESPRELERQRCADEVFFDPEMLEKEFAFISEKYEGYKWIKVSSFKDDESKSWEERFRMLEKHHIEETTFLINEVRKLAGAIDSLDD